MNDYSVPLQAKREQLLAQGVLMMDPAAVYVEDQVEVGAGTMLLPGTILRGRTVIGQNCCIGPQVMLTGCTVEDGCTINASQCEESVIERDCQIGPYAHIRPHLTYVGDSDVGDGCNFGCGTITCNYDGFQKYRTTIGSGVFVGCNTNLVAPVTVEDGAFIAAGTTVTQPVPEDAMAIGRARQEVKEGWAAENRKKKGNR